MPAAWLACCFVQPTTNQQCGNVCEDARLRIATLRVVGVDGKGTTPTRAKRPGRLFQDNLKRRRLWDQQRTTCRPPRAANPLHQPSTHFCFTAQQKFSKGRAIETHWPLTLTATGEGSGGWWRGWIKLHRSSRYADAHLNASSSPVRGPFSVLIFPSSDRDQHITSISPGTVLIP